MNDKRLVFLAMAVGVLTGCSEGTGPGSADLIASLQTDLISYEAAYVAGEGAYQRYGFDLVASFSNEGTQTLSLARCMPDSRHPVFQVQGVGFESGFNRAWACVGHDQQFVVPPGTTRVDTFSIAGPTEWSGDTPVGSLEGDFELHYVVAACPPRCEEQVPPGLGVSNRFHVRVRQR